MPQCIRCGDIANEQRMGYWVCDAHMRTPEHNDVFIVEMVAEFARAYVKADRAAQINKFDGDPAECWEFLVEAVEKWK